jgi:MtaA/CmuA family methyltransferase
MTGKEILFKALRREETPRPAWVPFVGVHGAQIIGASASDYLRSSDLICQGLRKAHSLYKPDGLPVVFDLQIEAEILGCDLRWSEESPPSVISHPLAERDLASLPPYDPSAGRFPPVLDALSRLKQEIGDSTAFYGLITGPFTLALHLMGNNIFLEMFDNEEHVKEVLSFCAEVGIKTADAYLERGADVIAVVDPMTSQISAKHFETFVTSPINRVFDHIRERQSFSSIFVCGDASRNLEVMAKTHCDNISIDENIPLSKLKTLGETYNKSIGGNLKLTVVLLLGDEKDSKLDAIRCIETCGNTGFVLAPGCDIPWGTPERNLQAVAEMLHDNYQREVAGRTLQAAIADTYDDIVLPDYTNEPDVLVEIITLDSTSCAPCQYMLEAARQAAAALGSGVQVIERKIKTRDGIGRMVKLGVRNIPTICIDGEARFISILPDRKILTSAIEEKLKTKRGR